MSDRQNVCWFAALGTCRICAVLCAVLQCLWRCYAAECRSHCFATWCIHVQDASHGHGHHHHAHLARTLGRLGWRSGLTGGRPRKAGGGSDVGRPMRFTLLDGTAVAVALMCQTADVRGASTTKNSTPRNNSDVSSSNVFQQTQRESAQHFSKAVRR